MSDLRPTLTLAYLFEEYRRTPGARLPPPQTPAQNAALEHVARLKNTASLLGRSSHFCDWARSRYSRDIDESLGATLVKITKELHALELHAIMNDLAVDLASTPQRQSVVAYLSDSAPALAAAFQRAVPAKQLRIELDISASPAFGSWRAQHQSGDGDRDGDIDAPDDVDLASDSRRELPRARAESAVSPEGGPASAHASDACSTASQSSTGGNIDAYVGPLVLDFLCENGDAAFLGHYVAATPVERRAMLCRIISEVPFRDWVNDHDEAAGKAAAVLPRLDEYVLSHDAAVLSRWLVGEQEKGEDAVAGASYAHIFDEFIRAQPALAMSEDAKEFQEYRGRFWQRPEFCQWATSKPVLRPIVAGLERREANELELQAENAAQKNSTNEKLDAQIEKKLRDLNTGFTVLDATLLEDFRKLHALRRKLPRVVFVRVAGLTRAAVFAAERQRGAELKIGTPPVPLRLTRSIVLKYAATTRDAVSDFLTYARVLAGEVKGDSVLTAAHPLAAEFPLSVIQPAVPLAIDGHEGLFHLAFFPTTRHVFAMAAADEGVVCCLDGDRDATLHVGFGPADPLVKSVGATPDPQQAGVEKKRKEVRAAISTLAVQATSGHQGLAARRVARPTTPPRGSGDGGGGGGGGGGGDSGGGPAGTPK